MLEIGRTYRHPRNGVEITVRRDDRERYVLEVALPPGTGKARPHVHCDFEQEFHVVEGVAQLKVGGDRREARAGEVVRLPRGTRHVDPYNAGSGRLVFRNEIAPNPPFIPAYVETVTARLADGRLGDALDLSLTHVAVIVQATDGRSYGPGPIGPQRAMLPLFAAIGRRLGQGIEQP